MSEHDAQTVTLPDGRRFRVRYQDRYRTGYEYALTEITDPDAPPVECGRVYGARWITVSPEWEWRWSRPYVSRGYAELSDLVAALYPV